MLVTVLVRVELELDFALLTCQGPQVTSLFQGSWWFWKLRVWVGGTHVTPIALTTASSHSCWPSQSNPKLLPAKIQIPSAPRTFQRVIAQQNNHHRHRSFHRASPSSPLSSSALSNITTIIIQSKYDIPCGLKFSLVPNHPSDASTSDGRHLRLNHWHRRWPCITISCPLKDISTPLSPRSS